MTESRAIFRCTCCGAKLKKRSSWLEHKYLRRDVYVCETPFARPPTWAPVN